jgi:4-amino-4-deoxy-L-arabinose transferase-like glycosyltransferase
MQVRLRTILAIVAILLAAMALRVGEVQRGPNQAINDARSYLALAGEIAHHGDYRARTGSWGTRGPTALFPPAFPYFLALVDLLDGHASPRAPAVVRAARLSQALLGTLAVALTGLVAAEALGASVGLIALALAAVYPVMIETSGTLLSENLLVVLELASVWAALRLRRSSRPLRWAWASGGLAGLAILTHQNALVILVPLIVAAWPAAGSVGSARRRFGIPALLALAALLTVLPWTIRNAVEFHSFLPISDQAGETLLGTYNPTSARARGLEYRWSDLSRIPSARVLLRSAPHLREPVWESRALAQGTAYIEEHPFSPLLVAYYNARRMLDLGGSLAWRSGAASVSIELGTARIAVYSFWAMAVLGLVGAFTTPARSAPRWLWLVPILLTLSVVFVRMETPRFRVPLDPFLVMLAACGVWSAARRCRAFIARRR